jgi:type IV pilus assembly protein PilA
VKIRGIIKNLRQGEKGFTLIELLVVVAILGILAAVIILNVMGMMGSGRVEAANTETHNVQVAVLAAMVDGDVFELAEDFDVGPDDSEIGGIDIGGFYTGTLEATYTFSAQGAISNAEPTEGGKWDGLTYTSGTGWAASE